VYRAIMLGFCGLVMMSETMFESNNRPTKLSMSSIQDRKFDVFGAIIGFTSLALGIGIYLDNAGVIAWFGQYSIYFLYLTLALLFLEFIGSKFKHR
jgi:hypothetical protein